MEDGCSKRFDIGTLDLRAENYDGTNPMSRSGRPATDHVASGHGSLPPIAVAPVAGQNFRTSGHETVQGQGWER